MGVAEVGSEGAAADATAPSDSSAASDATTADDSATSDAGAPGATDAMPADASSTSQPPWTPGDDGGCPTPGPPYGGGEHAVEGGVAQATVVDVTGAHVAGVVAQICGLDLCAQPQLTDDAGAVTLNASAFTMRKPVLGSSVWLLEYPFAGTTRQNNQNRILMAVIVDQAPRAPEDVWRVARWAFVWLLRQAMVKCGEDAATRFLFERAIALDGLHLHLLEADESRKARHILLEVASSGAGGKLPQVEVEGRVLDEDSQRQFRVAASELEALLKRAVG